MNERRFYIDGDRQMVAGPGEPPHEADPDDPDLMLIRSRMATLPVETDPTRLVWLTADSLDSAWAEAEAALPEGWEIDGIYRVVARTSLDREWEVEAHESDWQGAEDSHYARGATPAAALRALAANLRESGA